MSEVVVGRRRGADGILIEIRAIGDCSPDELTEHVKLLLAAHEIIVRELRVRRAQVLALHLARENEPKCTCLKIDRPLAHVCPDCGRVFPAAS